MKRILLLLFSLSFILTFAQNNDQPVMGKTSYSPVIREKFLEQYNYRDEYERKKEVYKNAGQQWALSQSSKSTNANRVVTIVVHVVHNPNNINDPYISDAEILDMITIMSQDYTRTNPDANVTRAEFVGVAANSQMEFCLAQTDPNGNATTGIVRVDTDEDFFDADTECNEMKLNVGTPIPGGAPWGSGTTGNGSAAWDPDRYVNIWICNISNGAGFGTAGYAYLPAGAAGQWFDGLVVDAGIGVNVYGGFPNRTATHEIGHYFGLNHTWGDGDCSVDDGLTDTPNCGNDQSDVMNCNPSPVPNSCVDAVGDLPDQYENYMSYATCQNMFTQQQADLMNGVLNTDRTGIVDNGLCNTPVLTADFDPNTPTVTINAGQTVTFTDHSNGPATINSWNWTFTGGATPTQTTQGSHTITYNTPGFYPVTLTVGDVDGSSDTKTVADLVEVLDVLNANFTANITYAALNEVVTFTDLSTGPNPISSWDWNFGDSGTDNIQNTTHAYTAVGLYTVTLTVGDGTSTNVETKTDYIEVYDPLALNIIDFTGTPTIINVGETVEFELDANQTDADIDSIGWYFYGADQVHVMKTNTAAFDVTYSTGGIFTVEARAYRNNASDGDTLVKEDYIIVIDPDSVPVANFVATQSNIPVGTTIDFINLTTNLDKVDSLRWFIETDNGVITQYTDINPTGITYNVIGDWDVQLFVYSAFGNHDTIKLGYIHVYDPLNLSPITANFVATTVRLITQGESVRFEDLSEGDISNWVYSFDRGGSTPIEYEYDQNPEHTFVNAGYYKVKLVAYNSTYSDTLVKEKYVIVTTTPWPDPDGYCDTLYNLNKATEIVRTYQRAEYPNWGYIPGHYAKVGTSTKYVKRIAEKYETYTPDHVSAVLIPVSKSYAGTNDSYFRVLVMDATPQGTPNQILNGSGQKVYIKDLTDLIYNYIELDEPVDVDSVFFIGFKLEYTSPQDTFATYMAPPRAAGEESTIYVSTSTSSTSPSDWQTLSTFFGNDLRSSMALKVMGCVVNVPEIKELEANLNIYPNPASDRLYVELNDITVRNIQIEMFDITGKQYHNETIDNRNNKLSVDVAGLTDGFYLMRLNIDGFVLTKKVLIQR